MKNRRILKKWLSPLLVPAAQSYLKKHRTARFLGLQLDIPTGVFHPSFFFSTKTLGQYISSLDLAGKKLLEIGCGSGAISIVAARQGADVHSCDINPEAVTTTIHNAQKNKVQVAACRSDLFGAIQDKGFHYILNNPPYYPKDPQSMEEHAWYAGKDLDYFKRLFKEAPAYLAPQGKLLLVLTAECNLELIHRLAAAENLRYQLVYTRATWAENTYVFQYEIVG